ncbi:hypothetical protein MN116_006458 [Schistosoma mekongi]|uniref:Uncharacterized protein n=1 Tax=Schistosoma mekongi TaxID=38744 RepID=A0AAE2D4J9_SCHME|nr:hypothetical protein MN116_006458 [Schistosoma mekongi]
MDDDELTQEILDQFDLICTQHQNDHMSKYSNGAVNKNVLHSNKLSSCLSRSTSLDTKLSGCTQSSDFPQNDRSSSVERSEIDRLKKEVSVLREELYMKLGELATIKESASRSKATDSDTISKLESHLTSERNDFQRKLSELNAQIAFREADYRLVCSELARIKEEVAVNKQLLNERSVEYSPASQILISLTSPNPDSVSNQKLRTSVPFIPSADFHLPAPVTPIPSKRNKVPHNGRIWDIHFTNDLDDKPKSNNIQQQTVDKCPVLTGDDDNILLSSGPRKRQRCIMSPDPGAPHTTPEHCIRPFPVSLADASVETTDLLPNILSSNNHGLCYRISSCPFPTIESFNDEFIKGESNLLLSELLNLSISVPQNEINRCAVDNNTHTTLVPSSVTTPEDSAWIISDYYLKGISKLLFCQSDILNGVQSPDNHITRLRLVVKRLSDSVPYLLLRIEEQLNACINLLLNPYNHSTQLLIQSGHSSDLRRLEAEQEVETAGKENQKSSSINDASDDVYSHEISYLGEDPFAGAPASQIVTSLTYPQVKYISKQSRECSLENQKNKSCPSDIGYWFSTNPTVGDICSKIIDNRGNSNNTNSCSVYHEIMLNRSTRGMNQLKCLATILSSYCPFSLFEMVNVIIDDSFMVDNNLQSISNEIQHLFQMISSVLSRFMNKLADVFFQMKEGRKLSSSSSTTTSSLIYNELIGDNTNYVTCSIDHSSFKQSQHTSSKRNINSISSFSLYVPLITECFDLSVIFASFIKTGENYLLKNKISNTPIDRTNSTAVNTCFPELLNCIILASEACFGRDDEYTESTKNQFKAFKHTGLVNFIKNRPIVTLKPLISFLRLWRHMISQKHWPGGHCCDRWWDTDDANLNIELENLTTSRDVRQQYIEKLFGASIRCSLLALCAWVCQFFDQFTHTTLSLIYDSVELVNSMEIQRIDLLSEFSGTIAVLTQRDDILWPDNCSCKPQVYSSLIHLSAYPLQTLMTIPISVPSMPLSNYQQSTPAFHELLIKQKHCLTAFGQLTRALIGLLWRHGDQCFQSYTDCLPDYFCLITNLSRWIQCFSRIVSVVPEKQHHHYVLNKSSHLTSFNHFILKPELIEELYDFESGLETNSPSTSNVP